MTGSGPSLRGTLPGPASNGEFTPRLGPVTGDPDQYRLATVRAVSAGIAGTWSPATGHAGEQETGLALPAATLAL
ncbi:MAG: hypothetical protein QOD01_2374 [Actinomycetota bacterium]|nr:hypothetical protein [Actinomycetota bacterium]